MDYTNLKTNPKNPRRINKEQFEKLKKSISSFTKMLEIRPIAYDEEGIIWGGNMRYEALKALGIEMKPEYFKELKGYTDKEKHEFAIRDNIELGEFDDDILANEWSDFPLEDWGVDVRGWEKEIEEDEVPEVSDKPAISKLGEVYQLGRHRLMCGDSTKRENVEKLMNGKKADMVFTDPPYGIDLDADYSKMPSTRKLGNKTYDKLINDNKPFDFQLFSWINCDEQIWWGANYYAKTLPEGGSWYVWDKRVEEKFDRMFGSAFEIAWSKTKHKQEIARFNNTLFSGEVDARGKVHPTQKPTKLCGWFIGKLSQEGNIILDLFGGSGSTLIACEQLDRTCYMMELDPKYVDVIRKRYAKFIGEDEWQKVTKKI